MKIVSAIILLFTIILAIPGEAPAAQEGNPALVHATRLSEVRERFVEPPAAFRPAPLYVWNDDLQEDELARQLDEMKEQGITYYGIGRKT